MSVCSASPGADSTPFRWLCGNPPALKAFVAAMATEYLYQEDVHYMDGIMHTDSWMMGHDLNNAVPGAPDFTLDEEWVEKRFNVEPSVYTYMRHQRDGPFWDRASARGRYETIEVPGYHIGGWYDGYRNSLPRMLENVKGPGQGVDRSVGSRLAAQRVARSENRVATRSRSLVRRMAEGRGHRHSGRAGLRGLRSRLPPARYHARSDPRSLAVGGRMADRKDPTSRVVCSR